MIELKLWNLSYEINIMKLKLWNWNENEIMKLKWKLKLWIEKWLLMKFHKDACILGALYNYLPKIYL